MIPRCITVALRIKLGNLIVDAVVDTGSSRSIISNRLQTLLLSADSRVTECSIHEETVQIQNVEETEQTFLIKNVPFSVASLFCSLRFEHDFQLLDVTDTMILGSDFLKKVNAKVDVKNRKIFIDGIVLPLILYTSFDTKMMYIFQIQSGTTM